MCADSSTGRHHTFFCPSAQIGQLFGIFLKKISHHMSIVHEFKHSVVRYQDNSRFEFQITYTTLATDQNWTLTCFHFMFRKHQKNLTKIGHPFRK